MSSLIPVAPPGAKQTNCWSVMFIVSLLGIVYSVSSAFLYLATDDYLWIGKKSTKYKIPSNYAIIYIIGEFIWSLTTLIIYMYHTHHTKLIVTENEVEISMGPWSWGKRTPCCPGWFCSSQIKKSEIHSINRKKRSIIDILCRCYCSPFNWCCCHKSYNSCTFPYCCVCECFENDSPTNDMIQFNLTKNPFEFSSMCCKRCNPCSATSIITCCVYNRIAVSIKDESWIQQLKEYGYPVIENGVDLQIGQYNQQYNQEYNQQYYQNAQYQTVV